MAGLSIQIAHRELKQKGASELKQETGVAITICGTSLSLRFDDENLHSVGISLLRRRLLKYHCHFGMRSA
jgi:hypothetical protein